MTSKDRQNSIKLNLMKATKHQRRNLTNCEYRPQVLSRARCSQRSFDRADHRHQPDDDDDQTNIISRSLLDTIFEHRKKMNTIEDQVYYNRPYRSLLSNHSSDPCSIALYFPNLQTFLSLFPSEKCFRVSLFYLSSIKSNLISSPGCSSSFSQGAAAPPSSGIPGASR